MTAARAQQTFNTLNVKDLASNKITVTSTTSGSKPCPAMTEAQRDAIVGATTGQCIYNTAQLKINVYNGTIWKAAGGGIEDWAPSFTYSIGDVVIESFQIYQANTAHTSSALFATDIAFWDILSETSLQQAYDTSVSPQITTSTPLGSVDIKRGSASDTDNVLRIQNGAGSSTATITGAGVITGSNLSGTNTGDLLTKGQSEGSTRTTNQLQVPNKLLTNVGTGIDLNETGNKNILDNPSMEHTTYSTSWDTTGDTSTKTEETTVVIDGAKSAKHVAVAQVVSMKQSSTLYQAQFADGVQGIAMVRIKSDIALSVCSVQAGTVSTSNCVTTNTDSKWKLYKVPFVLGGTSNGISIASSGSVSGTVYIDDAFVGVVDISQELQVIETGSAQSANTASCQWQITGTSIQSFPAVAACPVPTIKGTIISAPATKIPGFILNPNPARVYDVNISGAFRSTDVVATSYCTWELFDGTNTYPLGVNSSTAGGATSNQMRTPTLYARVDRSSPTTTATTYQIRASNATAAGTCVIDNNQPTLPGGDLKFSVTSYGDSSTYSSSSFASDTSLTDVFSANISDAGVVSNENVDWINGNCSVVSTSNYPCTFNSGIFTVAPNCSFTNKFNGNISETFAAGPSSTGFTSRTLNSATAAATAAEHQIICQKQGADYRVKKTIVGQFNEVMTTPGVSKPKTCYYAYGGAAATLASPTECTTGTCIETFDSCVNGSAPAFSSTGTYTNFTIANGSFANSSYINCSCVSWDLTALGIRECNLYFDTSDQTWQTTSSGGYVTNISTSSAAGAVADQYLQIKCEGQAP